MSYPHQGPIYLSFGWLSGKVKRRTTQDLSPDFLSIAPLINSAITGSLAPLAPSTISRRRLSHRQSQGRSQERTARYCSSSACWSVGSTVNPLPPPSSSSSSSSSIPSFRQVKSPPPPKIQSLGSSRIQTIKSRWHPPSAGASPSPSSPSRPATTTKTEEAGEPGPS